MQYGENIVWIDLETTGLDPGTNAILEMALVITDKHLNVLAEKSFVIHHPEATLISMDEWARNQHQASGLLAEVRRSSLSLAQAEAEALALVAARCPPRACPLAGSSVCFDRRFLMRHMPRLEAHLSYRLVDVSSIKELVKRWYPDKALPNGSGAKHRAVPDIGESIAELRYYRTSVFQALGPPGRPQSG
ncbi:TPA: oligoribonuclease [Candidatus Acetothermia bacterium]|nr:oligoribonuclease [Candidatus Acetothermia bacterium]HAZ30121.1 oligoribonuclease [Candidatus Acetothermia bacterium]